MESEVLPPPKPTTALSSMLEGCHQRNAQFYPRAEHHKYASQVACMPNGVISAILSSS